MEPRVYISVPQPSLGLQRIVDALTRYCPGEVVHNPKSADIVIVLAIGRRDDVYRQMEPLRDDQQFAVIQLCLRATQKPLTQDWDIIWKYADVVWSYYDLNRMAKEDGSNSVYDNLYYAPLGADHAHFFPRPTDKLYKITTSGYSYMSESVRECWKAVHRDAGYHVAHLGPVTGENVHSFVGLTDNEVAEVYCKSEWVSGLRRSEGFELPAAEGALCGTRPILFDRPDMRRWYEPFGLFIQEGTRDYVIQRLAQVFKEECKPLTKDEIEIAKAKFDWKSIVDGFYERLL